MIETILILAFSLALFVYWFRYTVLLLLSEEQVEDHGAVIGQLSVLETREALRQASGDIPLDRLHRALDNDYRMLRYLLDHAAGMGLGSVEHYLLTLDYQIMKVWYRVKPNRRALEEMADVVGYIAYKMGERTAGFSQA
ncbi:MAG: hypothetical protein ABSG65_29150 [Bryobacteraceae bacterium]|jgi:hypothetical protein